MKSYPIKLSNYGEYLTGRTKAKIMVQDAKGNVSGISAYQIILDFEGVHAFAQSFCSELLFQLMEADISLENIVWENLGQAHWGERLSSEVEFLSKMKAASTI